MRLSTPPSAGSGRPVAAGPGAVLAGLPPAVAALLWRGDQLGAAAAPVLASGFAELDAELPGGGWPCGTLVELLQPQPSVVEWRLLGPALARVTAAGAAVVLVGPPKPPHPPGLAQAGVDARRLVWVGAETPAERLWCVEQLAAAAGCGAVVAWLPQAGAGQMRRLQLAAQGGAGPLFVCRPEAARHEASAAPLRLHASCAPGGRQVLVRVLKRRGPAHDGAVVLGALPAGLDAVLVHGLRGGAAAPPPWAPCCPSAAVPGTADAVGRAAPRSAVAH